MNDIKTIIAFSKVFKIIELIRKILVLVCIAFAISKLIEIARIKNNMFKSLLK